MEWTGVRYADDPTAERAQWIAAPPERVWALVSDIHLMPELSGELQEVECLGGATGPAVGSSFRGRSQHPARGEWETTSHVIACERSHEFAWSVSDSEHPTATWRFTLEARDGGAQLTQRARIGPAPSGLSLAIEWMPDKEQKIVHNRLREFETAMTAVLAELKRRAEASCAPRRRSSSRRTRGRSRTSPWRPRSSASTSAGSRGLGLGRPVAPGPHRRAHGPDAARLGRAAARNPPPSRSRRPR